MTDAVPVDLATQAATPAVVVVGGGDRSQAAVSVYRSRDRQHSVAAPWLTRLVALAVAGACLGVLVTAASIEPSGAGVGTHKQLGLQSCALLDRTGIPCPSCGMTTSFAWFVRGNLFASLYVQPMGTALALAAACTVWGGAYIGFTGRPIHRLVTLFPATRLLLVILGLFIGAWGWKLLIQLVRVDGW